MKEKLIAMLLTNLGPMLVGMISPDVLKRGVDAFLDAVEDRIAKSENKVDDALVLPLLKVIREAFAIADNDEEAAA